MPQHTRALSLLLLVNLFLLSPPGDAHGILPDEIPMAAGTALRDPGDLAPQTVVLTDHWTPTSLTFTQGQAILLILENASPEWHLLALVDDTALRDQNLIHRLMPDLRKDYPNTRLSEPDTSVQLPWRFDKPGEYSLRCVRAEHQQHSPALTIIVDPPSKP